MGKLEDSNTSLTTKNHLLSTAVNSVVGEIFYSRKSSILDTIRFYQVTQMITDNRIIIRELHQMNSYGDELSHCSPIVGRFISEGIEVILNKHNISKDNEIIGTQLSHAKLTIGHGVNIKIWESIQHK